MSLKYRRQYVTQKELAFEFEVGEATAHDYIVRVEDTLVKSGKFGLPGKKALCEDVEIKIVLVDVAESPIERPQKNNENGTWQKEASQHLLNPPLLHTQYFSNSRFVRPYKSLRSCPARSDPLTYSFMRRPSSKH